MWGRERRCERRLAAARSRKSLPLKWMKKAVRPWGQGGARALFLPPGPAGVGDAPEKDALSKKGCPATSRVSPYLARALRSRRAQGPFAAASFLKAAGFAEREKKGGRGWFRGAKGEAQRISTPSATRTGRRENAPQDGQRRRDRIGSPLSLLGGPGPVSGGLLAAKEQGSALFPPAKQAARSCLGRLARRFFPPAATRGGSGGGSREKPRFQAKKPLFLPLFFHKVLLAFPPCIKYNNAMLVGKSGEKW